MNMAGSIRAIFLVPFRGWWQAIREIELPFPPPPMFDLPYRPLSEEGLIHLHQQSEGASSGMSGLQRGQFIREEHVDWRRDYVCYFRRGR